MINLSDVFKGVLKRRLFVVGVTLLSFVGSFAYVSTTRPRYTTEAQVLVENMATPYDQTPSGEQRGDAQDARAIQSQVAVLKSQDLARRVIDQLNLQNNEVFKSGPQPGFLSSLLISTGFAEDPRKMSINEYILNWYEDGLTVFQVPESNVITLKFTAKDADIAAQLLNTLAGQYVEETAEQRLKPTARAREWLGQQITDLRTKVAKSEAKIEQTRSSAGLFKGEISTLGMQELSGLNAQITAAETASADAEQRAQSIRTMLQERGTVDDSVDVLNSPIIQRLREQQTTAARKVAELSAIYLSSHPKMVSAQNDLTNIDKQLRKEALKIVDGLAEQARIAKGRQAALKQRLAQAKVTAAGANLEEVNLKSLERDTAADRSLLESLLLRYADASARQSIEAQPAQARVIQQALVPSLPSFPKKGPTVLLITIAGFVLSLGLAFLLEIMAAASRAADQAASVLSRAAALRSQQKGPRLDPKMPPLTGSSNGPQPNAVTTTTPDQVGPGASITTHGVHTRAANNSQPQTQQVPLANFSLSPSVAGTMRQLSQPSTPTDSELGQPARQVAQWIIRQAANGQIKRFGLIATEAATLLSASVAIAVGRACGSLGRKTVMLDFNPGVTGLHSLVGLSDGPGLTDMLMGKSDFASLVLRDTASPMHLIRYGRDRSPQARAQIVAKLEQILTALEGIYDVILINMSDLASSADLMAGKVHAALLISPQSRLDEVMATVQSVRQSGMTAVEAITVSPSANELPHLRVAV